MKSGTAYLRDTTKKMSEVLVSISCTTYNQINFIRKCLDGFLMQKTNFNYEIIIYDDASTDGTNLVIQKYAQRYPGLFNVFYQKENQYSQGIRGMMPRFNFPRAKGKYIALCEGDDYWTDPLKLQKQVDYLERNKDDILVFHNAFKLYSDGHNELFNVYKRSHYEAKDLWDQWLIPTATVMFRNSNLFYPDWLFKSSHGDLGLFLLLGEYGSFGFINEASSVYRIHEKGVTTRDFNTIPHKKKHLEQLKNMNSYFQFKYKSQIAKRSVGYLLSISYLYARMINKKEAIRFISQSFSTNVVSTLKNQYLYKSLLYLILSWKRKKH